LHLSSQKISLGKFFDWRLEHTRGDDSNKKIKIRGANRSAGNCSNECHFHTYHHKKIANFTLKLVHLLIPSSSPGSSTRPCYASFYLFYSRSPKTKQITSSPEAEAVNKPETSAQPSVTLEAVSSRLDLLEKKVDTLLRAIQAIPSAEELEKRIAAAVEKYLSS